MKKNLLAFLTAPFAVIAIPLLLIAQAEKSGFRSTKVYSPGAPAFINTSKAFGGVRMNDINIRAVRDLINNYYDLTNLHWYRVDDGFIAKFTADSVETKAEYDIHGRWSGTLRTFNEAKMPFEIRDIVRRTYCDFTILVAYEIKTLVATVYIVKIEDKTKMKTLTICDGEITQTIGYVKG